MNEIYAEDQKVWVLYGNEPVVMATVLGMDGSMIKVQFSDDTICWFPMACVAGTLERLFDNMIQYWTDRKLAATQAE